MNSNSKNPPIESYEINSWEIFNAELSFWGDPSSERWGLYPLQFAIDFENLVIKHFKSNSATKMKRAPEYDQYLSKILISILDSSVKNESPFEFVDEEENISKDIKTAVKIFSRLFFWTEDYVVTRENNDGNFFEVMFAFGLRQCNITSVYSFLEYHLHNNFQENGTAFVRFLKPLTNKYQNPLFNDALTTTIFDWIEHHERIHVTKISTQSSKEIPHSFELQNANDFDRLVDLLNGLKKHHFVSQKTSLPNFRKLFRGEEIIAPVLWTGNVSELYYFIMLLHHTEKKIKTLNKNIWKVTANCFVTEEGGKFDWQILSKQHKPKSADALSAIVTSF